MAEDRTNPPLLEAEERRPTDPSVPLCGSEGAATSGPPSGLIDRPNFADDRKPTDPSGSAPRAPVSISTTRPESAKRRSTTALGRPTRSSASRPSASRRPAHSSRAPALDEHVGKIFDEKYKIDRLIAKGGMGRVYLATQYPLERPVAIKILKKEFQSSDPQFVRRFFLEASIAAQLSHPHTITVFDYGEAESGELYIAMEYLRGRSLSKVLKQDGAFPAVRSIKLATQICRALREAHNMGIIHRDLKPGNVFLLDDGEDEGGYAKVLDFGLVKLFTPENSEEQNLGMLDEGDDELTRTGTLLGSPKYMSPEQIKGKRLDPRTDIYSFGIILYQMITGTAPFSGATGVDVIYKHINHPVPPVHSMNADADCPPELEDVVMKCLEKQRDDRYASLDELLVALKEVMRLLTGQTVGLESVAELSLSPARLAQMKAQAGGLDASASNASFSGGSGSLREAVFDDPAVDEPTPHGTLSASNVSESRAVATPPQHKASIGLAALGFAIALLALGYVLLNTPQGQPASAPQTAQPQPDTLEADPAKPTAKIEPAETPPKPPESTSNSGQEAKLEDSVPARKAKTTRPRRKKRKRSKVVKAQPPPKEEKKAVPSIYRENPY